MVLCLHSHLKKIGSYNLFTHLPKTTPTEKFDVIQYYNPYLRTATVFPHICTARYVSIMNMDKNFKSNSLRIDELFKK